MARLDRRAADPERKSPRVVAAVGEIHSPRAEDRDSVCPNPSRCAATLPERHKGRVLIQATSTVAGNPGGQNTFGADLEARRCRLTRPDSHASQMPPPSLIFLLHLAPARQLPD